MSLLLKVVAELIDPVMAPLSSARVAEHPGSGKARRPSVIDTDKKQAIGSRNSDALAAIVRAVL